MPATNWADAPWNDLTRATPNVVAERRYSRLQLVVAAGNCAVIGVLGGAVLGWNLPVRHAESTPAPTVTTTATATTQATVTTQATTTISPSPTPLTTFHDAKCATAAKAVKVSATAEVHGQAGTALVQIGGWSGTSSWPAGRPRVTINVQHDGKKGDACSISMISSQWQGRAS